SRPRAQWPKTQSRRHPAPSFLLTGFRSRRGPSVFPKLFEQYLTYGRRQQLLHVNPLHQSARVGGHRTQIRRLGVSDARSDKVRWFAPYGLGGLFSDQTENMCSFSVSTVSNYAYAVAHATLPRLAHHPLAQLTHRDR